MSKPKTLLAMARDNVPALFDSTLRSRLAAAAEVDLDLVVTAFDGPAYDDVEVLFTCWGVPRLDGAALARLPNLKAVVHAAGSVKGFVTEECWERGIVVSSAVAANAVPVAEYTLAMILLSGKRVLEIGAAYGKGIGRGESAARYPSMGNYGRRIGIVGASRVGRALIELLRPYEMEVLLSDPTLTPATAEALGVRLVPLAELVETCDVVSIHAPDVPETHHMFDAAMLGRMRPGATLINTARGRLVDTDALVEELRTGRIFAVLDVTDPEPLAPDHPLFGLENAVITPHLAGSLGNELHRMAALAIAELERYADGREFEHPVLRDQWAFLA